jgi:phosphoribosylformylglycinamidine cyclo-ligase
MARTYNCGIGMAVIVSEQSVDQLTAALSGAGEQVLPIGRIAAGQRGCDVSGAAGTWASTERWTASHDA